MNMLGIMVRTSVVVIMVSLCGCGMIDFREKSLATETKGVYLDASIPTFYSSGPSFCSIKLGFMVNKYISAPDGGKATIEDEYSDISIWTLSGNGKSRLSVENDADTKRPTTPSSLRNCGGFRLRKTTARQAAVAGHEPPTTN